MDKFKEKIRKRTIWMSLTIIFAGLVYVILLINKDKLPEIPDFTKGFQIGAFLSLELIMVFLVIRDAAVLNDEKALKKLYIEETDERKIMINQKSSLVGSSICYIGLALATIIAGFFNQIIMFTLLGATVFIILVVCATYYYFARKY